MLRMTNLPPAQVSQSTYGCKSPSFLERAACRKDLGPREFLDTSPCPFA